MYDQITPLTPSNASTPATPHAAAYRSGTDERSRPGPLGRRPAPLRRPGLRPERGPGLRPARVRRDIHRRQRRDGHGSGPCRHPGRQRGEHRLARRWHELDGRHRQGRQPGGRHDRRRRHHLDRSGDRSDRAGLGDRLRRHLRCQRADPDQPSRRRGRSAVADGQPQGRPFAPGHGLRHRHPDGPRDRQGRRHRPAHRAHRRLVDDPGRPAGDRHRQPARRRSPTRSPAGSSRRLAAPSRSRPATS